VYVPQSITPTFISVPDALGVTIIEPSVFETVIGVTALVIAVLTPDNLTPPEPTVKKDSEELSTFTETTFVSEMLIPLPAVWSFTKSNVLIYTGFCWFAITSFNAVPVPLLSSVNVEPDHVPLTTEPDVTTKSLGILIVPIVVPPCATVYDFNTSPEGPPSVIVIALPWESVYNASKAAATFVLLVKWSFCPEF